VANDLMEIVKGEELHLNLNDAQKAVWNSDKRFVFLFAGTQAGKTSFAPHWLFREIQRTATPFDQQKPNELNDYLVVTSTFPLLNLKLLPAFRLVYEDILKLGTYNKSERVFYFNYNNCKGRIIFCSAENPESMESATAKAAVLDECGQIQFRKEAWDAVLRRLSLAQGRVLGITTLYSGGGWLKNEIYDPWKRQDAIGQNIDVFQYPSTVNPRFANEEFERARVTMSDWLFSLLYLGIYTNPVGLIYDSFNTEACLINRNRSPIQPTWPYYCGMDFGNDTAALFYTCDPGTGFMYLDKEYSAAGLTTEQHVSNLKNLSRGLNIIKCVGGKGDKGDDGWRGDFTKAGWPVLMPSVQAVEVGIQRVYAWHKLNKLFVFSDLYDYLREKQSYSYKLGPDNVITGEIENKQRYHRMDAERYILSEFNLSVAKQEYRPIDTLHFGKDDMPDVIKRLVHR
jgi:hypothetical protein